MWVIRSVAILVCAAIFGVLGMISVEVFLIAWFSSGFLGQLVFTWRIKHFPRVGRTIKRVLQEVGWGGCLGYLIKEVFLGTIVVTIGFFMFVTLLTFGLSIVMGPISLLIAILSSRKLVLEQQYTVIKLRTHIAEVRRGTTHYYHREDCVRRCNECEDLSPLAPCPACGTAIYEPGLANDDGVGIFCTVCQRGFTDWSCLACGHANPTEGTLRSWLTVT